MRTRGKTGKSEKWFCCTLSECNGSLFFFLKQLNHLSDQLAPPYNLQNLMRPYLHSFLARSILSLMVFIAWQNHFEVNSIESTLDSFYFLIGSLIFGHTTLLNMTWMSWDQKQQQKFVRLVARLFTYARHGICLLSLYVQAVNVVFVFFQFLLGRKGWLIWTIKAFEISSQVFWRIWWLGSSACRACWSCWRRCHIIPEESIRYIDSLNRS